MFLESSRSKGEQEALGGCTYFILPERSRVLPPAWREAAEAAGWSDHIQTVRFFEAIPAWWVEGFFGFPTAAYLLDQAPASLLVQIGSWPASAGINKGTWYRVTMAESSGQTNALQLCDFTQNPVFREVVAMEEIDPALALRMTKRFALHLYTRTADEMTLLLAPFATACSHHQIPGGNGKVWRNEKGEACLYENPGGPSLNGLSHAQQLDFSKRPPIVLSCWNWENWHWVLNDGRAHQVPWIVPDQAFGPFTYRFAAKISRWGNINVFPSNRTAMTFPFGSLTYEGLPGEKMLHIKNTTPDKHDVAGKKFESPTACG